MTTVNIKKLACKIFKFGRILSSGLPAQRKKNTLGYFIEKRRRWIVLFYIFCALAVLSKGPVGIILPFLIVFCFLFFSKNLSVLKDMLVFSGIFLFFLIVMPWYVAATIIGGWEFFHEFIIKQNITRFFDAFDHIQPFYYYIDRILTHFFPWSLFLIPALIVYCNVYR